MNLFNGIFISRRVVLENLLEAFAKKQESWLTGCTVSLTHHVYTVISNNSDSAEWGSQPTSHEISNLSVCMMMGNIS